MTQGANASLIEIMGVIEGVANTMDALYDVQIAPLEEKRIHVVGSSRRWAPVFSRGTHVQVRAVRAYACKVVYFKYFRVQQK